MSHSDALQAYEAAYANASPWGTYEARATTLLLMGFASYQEYLKSDLWKRIRARAIKKNKGRCRKCQERATEVHHSRYDRATLTGQDLRHLHPVCRLCHGSAEIFDDNTKAPIQLANASLGALTKGQTKYWANVKKKHDKLRKQGEHERASEGIPRRRAMVLVKCGKCGKNTNAKYCGRCKKLLGLK